MKITIKHQTEYINHTFDVVDASNLKPVEVWAICTEMNVQAILVNGKYYECKFTSVRLRQTQSRIKYSRWLNST